MSADFMAFLAARLAEDDQIARYAGTTRSGKIASWRVDCECGDVHDDDCYERRIEGDNIVIYDEGGHDEDQARHIARHDPACAVVRVEAGRRILERHDPHGSDHCWNCVIEVRIEYGSPVVVYAPHPCPDLRDAAAPFVNYPDYKETWRP